MGRPRGISNFNMCPVNVPGERAQMLYNVGLDNPPMDSYGCIIQK